MAVIAQILENVQRLAVVGNAEREIAAICSDSRQVTGNSMFIAIRGTAVDGHDHIDAAIKNGACCIVAERMPQEINDNITYVRVADTAAAIGKMASSFYDEPSAKMRVVGITGTNGKTTTATLLFHLFEDMGYKCGLISTVQNHIHDKVVPATHTTPDAISLQALLAAMVTADCSHVFMEVSSHAIHQQRISGIVFAGGVFTNITHDHLDYHKTFDEYIRVKKSFFDGLLPSAFALTNADDKRGMVMIQNTAASRYAYSLRNPVQIKGRVLENNLTGLVMDIEGQEIHFRVHGTFNAYNLLAVYGAATCLGEDKESVLQTMSGLEGAPGRFETIMSPKQRVLGIIDYAHTPDALINVLATVGNLRGVGQQIITVAGCGGDRDKTKRPIMAAVVCEHSDRAIFTSDNPRSEDPEEILNEMEAGVKAAHKPKYLRITDRREAIKTACLLAKPEDIILVAGKGHEKYQDIKGVKHPFDDRAVLAEAFNITGK